MSTESSALVSIVIPCYNDYKYIEEAINSAICQTYDNIEIIIVDDGSDEQTKNVLINFSDKVDLIITKTNGGLSSARNLGIKCSRGSFILLLDSDDKFEKTFLEKAIPFLINNKNCGAVTCWGQRFINDKYLSVFKPKGGSINNFLYQNAAIGTSLIRKACWKEIGGYDESMNLGYEDWEFYIRLSQKYLIAVVPEILFFYRQGQNSMRKIALENHDKSIKQYIYNKHKTLYIANYEATINQKLKKELTKSKNTIDYKVGRTILKPLRKLKLVLSS